METREMLNEIYSMCERGWLNDHSFVLSIDYGRVSVSEFICDSGDVYFDFNNPHDFDYDWGINLSHCTDDFIAAVYRAIVSELGKRPYVQSCNLF